MLGDVCDIKVKFPKRPAGPGAVLSEKEAIFDVNILEVKTKALPPWDQALASRIRDGMSLQELETEVRNAVDTEKVKASESKRSVCVHGFDCHLADTTFLVSSFPCGIVM
jgi:FKBP-type peptidyl-prolyl cis-trans isomerase (trigger factor)